MGKEDFSMLTKKRPEKTLVLSLKRMVGRSKSGGMITTRHKGGGEKKLYRIIDFGQNKLDIPAKVIALEYDPNRTGFIALLLYEDGEKRYIVAPQGLKVGDKIIASEKCEFEPGNRMKLKNMPVGTEVYNVEIEPNTGAKLVRSAGASAKVLAQEGKYTHLKMPSSEVRKVNQEGFATIGVVSRSEHMYVKIGKAGRKRHMGIRPTVRGSAMVPADHPHGGGEGRAPIGMPSPKTPWGKIALGRKTRKKKNYTNKFIIKRRMKRKKK
jgi:large subunit ribosomal protein L2